MNKSLKIDLICNDGSPLGVVYPDIYGENGRVGVGGAELALLTLCEGWVNAGHSVRVYNSPTQPNMSPFPQYPIDTFVPHEERDILVIFRSPNHRIDHANGKKIWWSCDQYTVGDFVKFATKVDRIVTISPFHAEHFKNTYGIMNTTVIDLPVRLDDYFASSEAGKSKIPNSMIFCSVPDRGLNILAQAYPRIKQAIPNASLTITSDYRLWGLQTAMNEQHIRQFMGMDGVKFLGAIPRRQLVEEQIKAQIMAYPSTYDELFAIAIAECSVAGAYPVTSSQGAISTTNMGTQVLGQADNLHWVNQYAEKVIEVLKDKNLLQMSYDLKQKAIERFSLSRILSEWDKVLYG